MAKTGKKVADESDAFPRDHEPGEEGVTSVRRVKKPDFSKGKRLSHRIGGFWRPVKGETFAFLLIGTEQKRGDDAVNDDGEKRMQIIGQLLTECSCQRINAKKDAEGNSVISTAEEGEVISFGDIAGLKPLLDLEMGGKYAVQVTVVGQEKMKTRSGKFWNLDVIYTPAEN